MLAVETSYQHSNRSHKVEESRDMETTFMFYTRTLFQDNISGQKFEQTWNVYDFYVTSRSYILVKKGEPVNFITGTLESDLNQACALTMSFVNKAWLSPTP